VLYGFEIDASNAQWKRISGIKWSKWGIFGNFIFAKEIFYKFYIR